MLAGPTDLFFRNPLRLFVRSIHLLTDFLDQHRSPQRRKERRKRMRGTVLALSKISRSLRLKACIDHTRVTISQGRRSYGQTTDLDVKGLAGRPLPPWMHDTPRDEPPPFGKPLEYHMVSASGISDLLRANAPHLSSENYVAAAQVFPMRANNYVIDQLIDWSNVPHDPIFRLVFPQPEMLEPSQLDRLKLALEVGASKVVLRQIAEQIRASLNPHPAGQKTENVPMDGEEPIQGIQHKYRETALFFPTEGQYCHSFCTYCFRWAQFTAVGSDQAFQTKQIEKFVEHAAKSEISDVLFTGGDPMVMKTHHWEKYLHPIITDPRLDHLGTVRIGTKSLAYWPERYVNDKDAHSTLELFRRVVQSGRHLSIMAHFVHPQELKTPLVQEAIRRIRETGAQIRCQAPLIRGINDDAATWAEMWRLQTRLGLIPYYMFVERDTGAKAFFEVPLARAFEIYKDACESRN